MTYFILMKECNMQKKMKGSIFSKSRDNETTVALPGSLWYLMSSEFTEICKRNISHILFKSAEQAEYYMQMSELNDIIQLSDMEFEMLLAVTTCKERASIYKANEHNVLQYACKILNQWLKSKAAIYLDITDDGDCLTGELKYVGHIPGFIGYWFGVELPMVIHVSYEYLINPYCCYYLFMKNVSVKTEFITPNDYVTQ